MVDKLKNFESSHQDFGSKNRSISISSLQPSDLARIRNNQRRSRARRKEYTADLEKRLHQCERRGIEATA